MNSHKHLTYWFIACISIFFLFSCAENGEPGPQGEKGDQGEKGEQGDQGEKGDPGSVDIIYSDWSQLDWNLNDSPTYLAHKMEVSELTEEFIEDGGILLMYIKSENYIYPIPLAGGNDFVYYEIALPGELTVYVGTDGLSVESSFKEGEYRYILIPVESNVNGRLMAVDLTHYMQVKNFYNLPD